MSTTDIVVVVGIFGVLLAVYIADRYFARNHKRKPDQ